MLRGWIWLLRERREKAARPDFGRSLAGFFIEKKREKKVVILKAPLDGMSYASCDVPHAVLWLAFLEFRSA